MAFMNTQGMGASMQPVSIFKFKRGAISEMVRLITSSHQTRWNTQLLTEPLGGTLGQNLLHIAALQNRAAICGLFLQSLDKEADEQAELVLKSGRGLFSIFS